MDMKKYLIEDALPFWLENAIDWEQGGIFTSLDRQGKIYSEEKSVWFQGRALWVFSKAYNLISKEQAYLDTAKKIYDFLPTCTDTDGRMFFLVTREGKEIQKRRYYFSETFAAIGCAEFYKATGEREAWERAENYFATAMSVYSGETPTVPKYHTENRPVKSLSPVMIMLATAQVMESAGINSQYYGAICKKMTAEILEGGFWKEEMGALLEHVSPDGSFLDTPLGRTVNPGHSLEAAWFLMSEGVLRNNGKALEVAKKIMDCTTPLGWDEKHGGIIAFTDILGNPPSALEWDMKLWWPQCEAIIAHHLGYILYGEEKYREEYEKICAYAFEKFADREQGEWYGYLHYDSTVSHSLKGHVFKGPFHLPRMLMILATVQSLEEFKRYLR